MQFSTYKQILSIQPRDVKARQGLEYINGRFLNSGYTALENNDEGLARRSLNKLKAINPKSEESIEFERAFSNWKRERQISSFLASANQAVTETKLILPARENALHFYQQILLLDETNSAAISGIESIANNYVEKANEAIIIGEYEAAKGYLATVSVIEPKHPSIALIEEIIGKSNRYF